MVNVANSEFILVCPQCKREHFVPENLFWEQAIEITGKRKAIADEVCGVCTTEMDVLGQYIPRLNNPDEALELLGEALFGDD